MEVREDDHGTWRLMTEAEGFIMARRPGAYPTVFTSEEWRRIPLVGERDARRRVLEEISIANSKLSLKAKFRCELSGYLNLWQVDQAKDHELLRIPALGRGTLREIRAAIGETIDAHARSRRAEQTQ